MTRHIFLTGLSVKNANIMDGGVQLICNAGWQFIKSAKLQGNGISDIGVKKIVGCNWKYLS